MTKTMQEIEAISSAMPVPVGAAEAFTRELQTALPAQEYTGAIPLVEKSALVGVPLLMLGYAVNEGVGGTYVFVRCLLPNGAQVGFTDGGMAIGPVLDAHLERSGARASESVRFDENGDEVPEREQTFNAPLYCPRGLRESVYKNAQGIDASTYWIA